jgi:methyl-accepting chemotaxis protein
MRLLLATDAVAVGVTVIATLVLVALAAAVGYLLKCVRDLRREARELAREADALLGDLDLTVRQADLTVREAGREVERVDRMVGSAEAISDAVGSASRLVGGAVTAPFIKVVAFATGVAKGLRMVRGDRGSKTDAAAVAGAGRWRPKSRPMAGRRRASPSRSQAMVKAGEGRR